MSERALLITVVTEPSGTTKETYYYHRWGIGRILPYAVMQCIINAETAQYHQSIIDAVHFDTVQHEFIPVGQRMYEQKDAPDYNARYFGSIAQTEDNDIGAVILFVRQTFLSDKERQPIEEDTGIFTEFYRLGFLFGHETARDTGEKPFSRWIPFDEWSSNDTIGISNDNKGFIPMFKEFLKFHNVTVF